ncbi:MAG TPA: hypothetical protein GX706_03625 [Candidatus Moranbacteria bacterium]|nr:hypothetical protein [Candidatus Moranbacteria bacterium]
MKRLISIILAMAFFCLSGNALAGDYLFKTYPESHRSGCAYTVSLACKNGVLTPFVKGYEKNPDPIGVSEIQDYVKSLKKHPDNGKKCSVEHEPLDGTWKPFKITPQTPKRKAGEKTVLASKKPQLSNAFGVSTAHAAELPTTIRLEGSQDRIELAKTIIRMNRPADYSRLSFQEVVNNQRGNKLIATALNNGVNEEITLTDGLLRSNSAAIRSGNPSAIVGLCAQQAPQLGRVVDAALAMPATQSVPTLKLVPCPPGKCRQEPPSSNQACSGFLQHMKLPDGSIVDLKVCGLDNGKKIDGETSVAWRCYGSGKMPEKGIRFYSVYFEKNKQLEPGVNYWSLIPKEAIQYLANLPAPNFNCPGKDYVECWKKFPPVK